MTIATNNLSYIESSLQDIYFYNWNYDDVISKELSISVISTYNIEDSMYIYSSFNIESFETTRGRIESFSDSSYTFCELEYSWSDDIPSLSPIYSPVSTINYMETKRYEVFPVPTKAYVSIPDEIRILGTKLLTESHYIVITSIESEIYELTQSIYDSVLKGANRSLNPKMIQKFFPKIGKSDNVQYNVNMKLVDIIRPPVDNISIMKSLYINNITFLTEWFATDDVSPELWMIPTDSFEEYQPEPSEEISIDDIYSSGLTLIYLPMHEPIYSPVSSFLSENKQLSDVIVDLAVWKVYETLEPFVSNELKMINIVRGSISNNNVPVLLSNNDKGFTLTSSSSIHGSYPLYHLFDRNIESYTISTDHREMEVLIQLPEISVVHSYSIGCGHYNNASYDAPSEWTLYWSIDGINFTQVDSVSLGRQMNAGEIISREVFYGEETKFLKMYITHTGMGGGWTRLGLLDFIFDDISYGYKIIDTDSYYSSKFEPSVKVYSNTDYFNFDDIVYAVAEWNDHKNLNYTLSSDFRFSISEVEEIDLDEITMVFIELEVVDMPIERVDLLPYMSMHFMLFYTEEEFFNGNGLYRDIFIDSLNFSVNEDTPWLLSDGSIKKISDSKFNDISFEHTEISVYKISSSNFMTVMLDWEKVVVNDSTWMVPSFQYHPYIRINSYDGDFIIISLSKSGGSVTHLHPSSIKNDFIYGLPYFSNDEKLLNAKNIELLDASMAEAYASNISSSSYRRSAKVIHDTMNGLVYNQWIINDAMLILDKYEYCVNFFSNTSCNPIVLDSIIKDKMSGMVDRNIFVNDGVYEYGGVSFIHYDDDEIESGGVIVDYVISHEDVTISESKNNLNIIFTNLSPGDYKYIDIIENCGSGSLCSNKLLSGLLVTGMFDGSNTIPYMAAIKDESLLFRGGESFQPSEQFPDEYIDFDIVRFRPFVKITTPKNINGILSKESRAIITIGTKYDAIYYDGHFRIGKISLSGIYGEKNRFNLSTPDKTFDDVYSEFRILMTIHTRSNYLSEYSFDDIKVKVNIGFISLEDVFEKDEYIWLKMFFPSSAGQSEIESTIMGFNITDREFGKNFYIPYRYVDDPFISPQYRTYKSSNGDIREVKEKEMGDPFSDTKRPLERRSEVVCGPYRTMTYLDYQNFDHIFTYDNNRIYGNYTKEIRELLMSGYIRIETNDIIAEGKKLSDADALKNDIYSATLSFIDNLDVVADWHIEEFVLDYADFGLEASQAERLSTIDEQISSLLKAVLSTLGDDIYGREIATGDNPFPQYPDRPSPVNDFEHIKVQQYYIVEEVKIV